MRASVKKQDRINKNSDNANEAKEELLIQFLIDCSGSDFCNSCSILRYCWTFSCKLLAYPLKVREPHYLCLNLFGGPNLPRIEAKNGRGTCELTKAELKGSEHILPILPISKGFKIDYYRHNG